MLKSIKNIVRKIPYTQRCYHFLLDYLEITDNHSEKPVDPHEEYFRLHKIKENNLRLLAEQYACEILIETGTYYGQMVEAMRNEFKEIYSIELSEKLFLDAENKFAEYGHIHLFHGDSAVVLPEIIPKMDRRALFWLDGHYSAGDTACGEKQTPVFEELDSLTASPDYGHVIVIDDARLFDGTDDYPTLSDLCVFLKNKGYLEHHKVTVVDDAIRILPTI